MTIEELKIIITKFQAEQLKWCDGFHNGTYTNHPRGSDVMNCVDRIYKKFEELKRKAQKSYTLGYVQGYLARENQEAPEDIRELLKDKQ